MEQITGHIERITFQSPDTGYTVAKLQEPGKRELTCIVGQMAGLQPGESVCCRGEWKNHPSHGVQFEIVEYDTQAPSDLIGIEKYLGSGLIKGIGPAYSKKIVEFFGVETLQVIDKEPHRLEEVAGLGKKRIGMITTCWKDQHAIRDVMIFLQKHSVSPALSQKIFKRYGQKSIEKLQENPFCVARDIHGFGFKTADQIASKLGIPKDSPIRIEAGVEYVLNQLASEGHVCYPLHPYLLQAAEILETTSPQIEGCLDQLRREERIVISDLPHQGELTPFIWVKALHVSEEGIAKEIARLMVCPSHLRNIDLQKALEWVQEKLNIELAEKQAQAVSCSMRSKVHIITGGPGTGKSTITNAILAITSKLTTKILLVAPTGRAAKRMSEITKRRAQTIHSLLEVDFSRGGFKKGRNDPVDCDLIIVDEASMIDTLLMYSLLKAIPDHARVIFVGDIDQLPSVGPGNVLKDLIATKSIPITKLTEIFRQAAGSMIITNAHRINQGGVPETSPQSDGDFFFMETEHPESILKTIISLVTKRLPQKYHFHPQKDIQILAPMKRGIVGTENINDVMQQTFHPGEIPLQRMGRKFCIGDKVMQTRNNYQRFVFNGDVGWITHIDEDKEEMVVNFEGKDVHYPFFDVDELILAYAVSIHKYQGSECPCIVMPIHTTHFKLLHRNLLYTGVTRGKQLVILVGTKKALEIAVRNNEVAKRYTGLKQMLIHRSTKRITACLG